MEPPRATVGARLLLLLCGMLMLSSAAQTGDRCPRKLDCTLLKRHYCPPGSDACGPCLPNHVENNDGKCVESATSQKGKTSDRLPDEDIDFYASLLSPGKAHQLQAVMESTAAPEESSEKNRAGNVTPKPLPPTKGGVKSSPVPKEKMSDALLLGLVVTCTTAGLTALIVATVCWCRLQKEMKLAEKADYSSNKGASPPPYDRSSPVDKKLAQSAQMYHYQHQKQQMLSMENKDEPKLPDSNTTSDEENEDGDFTVYECPGLAPTGEMEVKNPLFDDSSLHHPNSKPQ
ncbi:neural proliferation differentiation and control protein 1 isoform X2 [Ambystoma mexicanum]|uniref:neural proliferation differentiation and control protein 1 isoform X2 n=1 Tax=Ambystoma mexicanum TaxID=8296 RepID=UPI0037E90A17